MITKKNYLFIDKKTGQSFTVEEKNLYEAQMVADAYFAKAVFQKIVGEYDLKQSALALVARY